MYCLRLGLYSVVYACMDIFMVVTEKENIPVIIDQGLNTVVYTHSLTYT